MSEPMRPDGEPGLEDPNQIRWQGRAGRPNSIHELRERLRYFRSVESDRQADLMSSRPSDVYIATYPKCGTTLLQQMVHTLRTRGDMNYEEITAVVPWFESAWDMGIELGAEPPAPPRAFKTHRVAAELPENGRFIHMTRDPLAVADSFYRFFSGWAFEAGTISLDEFATHMILEGTKAGRYWDHLLSWWPRREDANVLLLAYEDFLADPLQMIQQVADLVGIDLDPELSDITLRNTSLEFMRRHYRQFDDHLLRHYRDPMLGLPSDGETLKVSRANPRRQQLSASVQDLFARRWQQTLGQQFGIPDYMNLRKQLTTA
ncbi:MAG: sulfotransferase domain-containing protein [Acidimicrobiales bacterium]|nr:sulfotransferase domain-containing protein [Acidimicrobiales bacterium]